MDCCYFCDSFHDRNSVFIYEFNNISICYECLINHNKPITIYNNVDCSICYECHKGIELPNCNHIICIDCYKRIYFGFITNNKIIKPIKREDAFTINESLHIGIGCYDFSQPLNILLESIDTKTKTKEYVEYETSFITYYKKQYDLDLQDIQYYNNKTSNIFNMVCPLCRK